MSKTTEEALRAELRRVATPNTRMVLNDSDAFSYMVKMFNGTLAMASGKGIDIAMGSLDKSIATVDLTSQASNSNKILLTSRTIQLLLESAKLASLAGKTNPLGIMATVGATLATKTSIALSMAGSDNKQATCIAAFSDMAAGGLTLTAGIAFSATGLGSLAGVALVVSSVSQILIGGYNAHKACIRK